MANKTIIIAGRADSMIRISYNAIGKSAKSKEFAGVVNADVTGSTRINALNVVVKTMEQMKEADLSKETQPTVILTLGMVVDAIHNGTALYWSGNDNKKSDGSAVNDTEQELWAKFYELYPELIMNIVFKDIKSATLPKNPKFAISMEQRAIASYVDQAWEMVKVTAPELVAEDDNEAL